MTALLALAGDAGALFILVDDTEEGANYRENAP
jgi:hypothetical protein